MGIVNITTASSASCPLLLLLAIHSRISSTTMADIKLTSDYVEGVDKAEQEAFARLPDALAGLSGSDLNKVGVKATMKLDLLIMPATTILYILNYLDRQNIAASKLANIMEDLNLSVTQFNTTVSILFVGYSKFNTINTTLLRPLTAAQFLCKCRQT